MREGHPGEGGSNRQQRGGKGGKGVQREQSAMVENDAMGKVDKRGEILDLELWFGLGKHT